MMGINFCLKYHIFHPSEDFPFRTDGVSVLVEFVQHCVWCINGTQYRCAYMIRSATDDRQIEQNRHRACPFLTHGSCRIIPRQSRTKIKKIKNAVRKVRNI